MRNLQWAFVLRHSDRAARRKSGLRARHWAGMAALGGAALLLAGLVRFAIPPAAENQTAPTDAIVVLTGGSRRLQSGIDLMLEGKGRALFVSGVDRRVDLNQLLSSAGEEVPRWLTCCIELGHHAKNTMGNAAETAQWMRERGYHSLRLVTSWYHMPRSLLEFERAMPGIRILPHPVFSERIEDQRWWAWHGTALLLISEYGKYLVTLFLPVTMRPSAVGSTALGSEARR